MIQFRTKILLYAYYFAMTFQVSAFYDYDINDLNLAAQCNNVHFAKAILESDYDMQGHDFSKFPPMYIAIDSFSHDVLQLFIDYHMHTYNKTNHHYNLIQHALTRKNSTAAIMLIKAGGNIHYHSLSGETLLHTAIATHSNDFAIYLLQQGLYVDVLNEKHDTPLHLAAHTNNMRGAEILMNYGANIHAKNYDDETPLLKGLDTHAYDVIKLLLQADFQGYEDEEFLWYTLIDMVAYEVLDYALKMHIWNNDDHKLEFALLDSISDAVYTDDTRIITMLINLGADINFQDPEDNNTSALHIAAWYNSYAISRMLIDLHANVNAINNKGETPLHTAAREGCISIARLLLRNGCNVNALNIYNQTALDCARNHGYDDIAKTLLRSGGTTGSCS